MGLGADGLQVVQVIGPAIGFGDDVVNLCAWVQDAALLAGLTDASVTAQHQ